MRLVRALALASLLGLAAPVAGCAGQDGPIPNPVFAAETLEQRALALLETYTALLETATEVLADVRTPRRVADGLIRAEAVATPAVETAEIALAAYGRARARYEADPRGAAAALAIAAGELETALAQAAGPVGALQALLIR
jgi:hypothetical protein